MRYSIVVALLQAAFAVPALAQEQPESAPGEMRGGQLAPLVKAEAKPAEERRAKILAEIESLKAKPAVGEQAWANEWAGEYYCGDHLGMNVTISIAPGAGLVYRWDGCMGLYDVNHGEIEKVLPDRIVVKLRIDPGISYFKYMSSELFLVRWGDRHYLVPRSQMMAFCNEYNDGSLARAGRSVQSPLKREDRGKASQGVPGVPVEFRACLLAKPIEAAVAEVRDVTSDDRGDIKRVAGKAVISAGRAEGVFVGMTFQADGKFGRLTVTAVDEHTCTATFQDYPSKDVAPNIPEKGWKVSTASWVHARDTDPADKK